MLILVAVAVFLVFGVAALPARRAPRAATMIGAGGAVLGSLALLVAALFRFAGGSSHPVHVAWQVPNGAIAIALDPLSTFFLVPVGVVGAAGAIYGATYLSDLGAERPLGPPWFFYNGLLASMALVLGARNVVLFLVAWECMTLTAWGLVTLHDEDPDVQRAGRIFLLAAHAGTLALTAMFLLLARRAGSFDFEAIHAAAPTGAIAGVVFVLALAGFGVKAGFVPLHVWLPEAHAAAPSHVSAIMSAVLIKLGVYGVLRTVVLLGPPSAWWGLTLMLIGGVGALTGIAMALQQRDLKRALACSSIENVGVLSLGLGAGLWAISAHDPRIAVLGIAGALFHVWNHAWMKGLMFLSAGSVLHGTGTKDIEKLGGLVHRMPRTAVLMTVGCVAISALLPLNGFVSEWLIYLGLLRTGLASSGPRALIALLSVGGLAFVGALTVFCFVRLLGIAMLGSPRSREATHAHEAANGMLGPMALLCGCIVASAVVPAAAIGAASPAVGQLLRLRANDPAVASVRPLVTGLGLFDVALLLALAAGALALRRWLRARPTASGPTWGCGYAAPNPRMQYTGRSFSEILAENLLPAGLRPRVVVPIPTEIFPPPERFQGEDSDPFLARVYEPALTRFADWFARLRWLQRGVVQGYLVYILVAVLVALAWATFGYGGGRP